MQDIGGVKELFVPETERKAAFDLANSLPKLELNIVNSKIPSSVVNIFETFACISG